MVTDRRDDGTFAESFARTYTLKTEIRPPEERLGRILDDPRPSVGAAPLRAARQRYRHRVSPWLLPTGEVRASIRGITLLPVEIGERRSIRMLRNHAELEEIRTGRALFLNYHRWNLSSIG